ncbi:ribosome recycling factor [Halocola ammonii]
MNEDVQLAIEEAKDLMKKAINHLETELQKIRAGKANPNMLSSVQVDYYGTMTPLQQVANVNTPDAKTLSIQPWEKSMLDPITTAIINSNLGLNPQNNGDVIMINIPALTEERRRDLTKRAKAEAEHGKVSIRNARKEANDEIKKAEKEGLSEDEAKRAEEEVQKITDKYTNMVDEIYEAKEKDIMTV